mmetsp:Transcript_59237/g.136716  ORF Transcript_59237/g.136716 Transcript_59237/m.136716 type:complete len:126 (+) Transcript_59237:214-591(+)|eukprot:CAMPEP_0204257256 /NCGR_PEP_ID=MMETSP0468-20130131/4307_1 /ASSEMBLY_ACC=CAM_ASM_000383 /TAXON_ID=2969 /ORGANISM="Oxyrrhis marina" /LENGTH=125 /DNA_ID=CAMNT_0051231341 /DNA_START=178 /DNA_END=555 /DNA_ORIENTATION=-
MVFAAHIRLAAESASTGEIIAFVLCSLVALLPALIAVTAFGEQVDLPPLGEAPRFGYYAGTDTLGAYLADFVRYVFFKSKHANLARVFVVALVAAIVRGSSSKWGTRCWNLLSPTSDHNASALVF